ncbi:uncharacterized protein LOC114466936 [Gouania willdenowi]|uniref:uncharacterized protein LOC114466936 n=1 Tax=Gouania willdenowi TaxID=441366 RepID=UPI001054A0BC|nr:uncharacterized protein LOC114466936 [Gouania willdenowi]
MTTSVTTGQKVSDLCEDGDRFLDNGDVERATSLYMSAFRTHATSAVSHMRKLDTSSLSRVISTMEGWLNSHVENQLLEAHNKGLAAVFLSTLIPNNPSATIYKMESLLQSGGQGCEEIYARCTALLVGEPNMTPQSSTHILLEITRGLACLFSACRILKGLKIYLKAYRTNKRKTVSLVKSRQKVHLPRIIKAFTDQIVCIHPSLSLVSDTKQAVTKTDDDRLDEVDSSDIIEFLLAISPGNREVQELQAAHLFLSGRFEDSAEIYSALLSCQNMSDKIQPDTPERTARLLTSRAAACFSAGGKIAEECRDLEEAFEIHPATARVCFQNLFTDLGVEMIARNLLRQQAERGLSGYRERVLLRQDLRSTEGIELLDPVITQLRTLCHLEPDGGSRELRVRLTECLLLRGEYKESLSICSQLVAAQAV